MVKKIVCITSMSTSTAGRRETWPKRGGSRALYISLGVECCPGRGKGGAALQFGVCGKDDERKKAVGERVGLRRR